MAGAWRKVLKLHLDSTGSKVEGGSLRNGDGMTAEVAATDAAGIIDAESVAGAVVLTFHPKPVYHQWLGRGARPHTGGVADTGGVVLKHERLTRCNQCAHLRAKLYEAECLLGAKTLPLNNRVRKHIDAINGRIEWLDKREEAGRTGSHLEREKSALRYAVNVIIAFGHVPEKVVEAFRGE